MPQEPQLLSSEFALGSLGKQLAATEDFEHLCHVDEVLCQGRRMD